jgi:uncharacterized damage-inducible protein DinB
VTTAEVLNDAFSRVREGVHWAVEGLSAVQLAARLDEAANSIAWLCWHLSRVQDDHLAHAFGTEQVWPAFHDAFGLPLVRVASGDLLTRYHDAVHEQTVRLVSGITDADLSRIVDERWDPPVTLGVRLVSVISDGLQHAGQAAFVRGILLRQG